VGRYIVRVFMSRLEVSYSEIIAPLVEGRDQVGLSLVTVARSSQGFSRRHEPLGGVDFGNRPGEITRSFIY
jgi:hypothetical protein